MIIIKKIVLIFIIFSLAVFIYASDGPYIFDHITRKDGLSNSSISSIVQDKDGFMWFGTQGGLNRYDGKNVNCTNIILIIKILYLTGLFKRCFWTMITISYGLVLITDLLVLIFIRKNLNIIRIFQMISSV